MSDVNIVKFKSNMKIDGTNRMDLSDKEFYGEFLKIREKLMSDGWTPGRFLGLPYSASNNRHYNSFDH